jgi:hypothetical protein
MKRFTTRARRTAAVVSVGLMALGLVSFGQVAAGEDFTGNPDCEALGYEFGDRLNDPSGTFVLGDGAMTATLTVGTAPDTNLDKDDNPNNAVTAYSIETTATEYAIVVKAASGGTVYRNPIAAPPLHAPINASGTWPTISHVDVCWDAPAQPTTGTIEVIKVVAGAESHEATTFQICVTPAEGEPICQDIVGAGTLLFEGLEPGDYVVTETDPGEHWTVVGSGAEVTVTAGDVETVTITNTRKTDGGGGRGQIWVTKVVEGDGAPSDAEFQICVTPVEAEATARARGEEPHEHDTCQWASDEETVKFMGLALGDYLITETDPGVDWDVTGSGVTVTLTRGGMSGRVTHTITNTWAPAPETGSLRVDKTVVRVGGDPTEFEICVRPASDDLQAEFEPRCTFLAHDEEPYTFTDLLPGTYEVYEPTVPAGWIVSVNPQAPVVVAGQTADVTVTNTWVEQQPPILPTTGSVALTKLVEGTPAEGEELDGTFELCLVGPAPATTELCRTVETDDGTGTVLISGLLPGTYTVTETPIAGYAVTISDETVTVVAGGLDAATITNTILEDNQEPVIPPVTPPTDEEDSDSGGPVPTPPTGALPHTGIELTLALVATATLGAGVLLLTVARRRTIR